MRVVATEQFKTYYGMVCIDVAKDAEAEGDFAVFLAEGGAPVRILEDDRPKHDESATVMQEPEVDDGPSDENGEADEDGDAPGAEATSADVVAWVGEDPERAAQALEAEQAREKPRSTLSKQLTRIAHSGQ